jgi:hypothetical protein
MCLRECSVAAVNKVGGKNMGYIMGPLQMALGAGALATGVGAPLGIPLLAAGAGETIGQGAGGSKGAGMGEMFGGLAGGLGEGGAGLLGFGPASGMLGGTQAGTGLQSFLGIGGSGGRTVEGLQGLADPYLTAMQGAGMPQGTAGLASLQELQDQISPPTVAAAAAPAAAASTTPSLSDVSNAVNIGSKVLPGGQQSQPTDPKPSFKGPVAQSPVASKGQAPATSVTPAVPQVPTAPKPPPVAQPAGPPGPAGPPAPQQPTLSDLILRHLYSGLNQ